MDLYIYYRVAAAQAEPFCAAVTEMQAKLSAEHQLHSLLKRRPEIQNGFYTWMEVYLAVPENFEQVIASAVKQSDIASWIDGDRHVESFLTVSKSGMQFGVNVCA